MVILLVPICLLGVVLIGFGEWLRRRRLIGNEAARKIIHLAHAVTIASWPFLVSYPVILAAELVFISVVLLARHYQFFKPLNIVGRLSFGEYFFPVAVIILALIQPPAWMFFVAMLHLGVADTLAALVGKRVQKGQYIVFDHIKTVPGTVAFWVASCVITYGTLHLAGVPYTVSQLRLGLFFVPIISALAENISPYGSDNLSVPLLVVGTLIMVGFS